MRIEPYKSVDDIKLAISQDSVISILGIPKQKRMNRIGLVELRYDGVIYRFDADDRLVEITADSQVVELGSVLIPFSGLAAYIRAHDRRAFEEAGFVVSPKYGVAFDPLCPSWVTSFPEDSLALWQQI